MSGIPSWAVPGAKVVCIKGFKPEDAINGKCHSFARLPRTGGLYIIKFAELHETDVGPLCFIGLTAFGGDGFDILQFRPLVSEADDLRLFRDIADKAPADLTEEPDHTFSEEVFGGAN